MKSFFATLFFLVAMLSQSFATTWYVKTTGNDNNTGSSWNLAFQNIQTALNAASASDEIWVAEGIYLPTTLYNGATDRYKTFLINKDVKIFGGFAGTEAMRSHRNWNTHPTVLSGDLGMPNDISDNAYHVVWIEGRSSAMELDGFTVTKGKLGYNDAFENNFGAGIYNNADYQNSTPTIRNCTITGNEGNTFTRGTAMYNHGYYGDASAIITDCIISNNTAPGNAEGAGLYNYAYGATGVASPVLTHCAFNNNTAAFRGGAIYEKVENSGTCAPVLNNCSFTGNKVNHQVGGAIYHFGQMLTLNNCTFTDNESFIAGAMIILSGSVNATDCVFTGNKAAVGSGAVNLQSTSGTSTFSRCTFSNNTASTDGGAFTFYSYLVANVSVYFDRCTFSDNSATNGGAIFTDGDVDGIQFLTMYNCLFFDNTATKRGGAFCSGANSGLSTNKLYSCTFYNNTAQEGGGGVVGTSGYVANQSAPYLINCIAWNNSSTFGQTAEGQGGVNIQYSLIQETGCPTGASCGVSIYNLDPLFVNAPAHDFHLQNHSPAKNSGAYLYVGTVDFDGISRPQGPAFDMGAFEVPVVCPPGPVVYVDQDATGGANNGTSWANAYTHLQDALDAAADCPGNVAEIWVAEGTYVPTALHEGGTERYKTFFIRYDVKIFGGFAGTETMRSQRNWNTHLTTLSGEMGMVGNADNVYHVVWISGRSSAMELDGFRILGGNADDSPYDHASNGGGIYNDGYLHPSNPTIRNCNIQFNVASQYGGGMYNNGAAEGASPILINCIFSNNAAPSAATGNGGGMYSDAGYRGTSSPVLTNCTFTNNSAFYRGGGVYTNTLGGTAEPVLTNCTFLENYIIGNYSGGGISQQGGVLTLTGCTFTDNVSPWFAGAIDMHGSLSATDCTFSGNKATAKGAGAVYLSNTVTSTISNFTRCTFSDNLAGQNGGGVSVYAAENYLLLQATFSRCTFSSNSAKNGGAFFTGGGANSFLNLNLSDCQFFNNTATERGGAYCSGLNEGTGVPVLNYCTFYNNTAGLGGGAIGTSDYVNGQAGPLVSNSILWGNSSTFSQTAGGQGLVTLSYSLIQETSGPVGATSGNLIYNQNPLFVNAAANNFHLQACSPAVDKANPASNVSFDFDLTYRPQNGGFDMGAFEYAGAPCLPQAKCKNATVTLDNTGNATVLPAAINDGSTGCNIQLQINNQAYQSYTCANVGQTVATLKATDCNYATSTCTATITVVDNQLPTITCPNNFTIATTQCTATGTYTTPTYTDNCTVNLTLVSGLPSGSQFSQGVTTNVWKATDPGGHTATCSFTVTVTGGQPMTIACPQNIVKTTDPNQCTAVTNYSMPTVSNPCGNATLSLIGGLASGSSFPKGPNTITWRATGTSGATVTCSFTVTVSDNQAPTIACPANQNISTDPNLCTAVTTYMTPTAADNCTPAPTVMLQSGVASGQPFPKGINTVIWKATDGAGLTKTCSFRVTVNDTQAPTIACPANQVRTTDANLCSAVATFANATFTDNCTGGSVVRWSGLASGSAFPKGVNQVVFKATDAAGSQSQCTMTITVSDAQLPTVTCPNNIAVTGTNSSGICSAVVVYSNPTASDNCGLQSSYLLSGLASNSVFPQGVTTNVWKATDGSGLTATCAFTVTVNCATNPSGSSKFEVRSSKLDQGMADLTTLGSDLDLRLAPNPATTQVTVTLEGLDENGGELSVFDAAGRMIWQQQVTTTDAMMVLDVSESKFAAGLYFVTLRSGDSVRTKRLTVQR